MDLPVDAVNVNVRDAAGSPDPNGRGVGIGCTEIDNMDGRGSDVQKSSIGIHEILPRVPIDLTPKIGQQFDSEEDAYQFYNGYAKLSGFSIRKSYARKLTNGEVCDRVFKCSKEGLRKAKPTEVDCPSADSSRPHEPSNVVLTEKNKRKYKERCLTRCNCRALLGVSKRGGCDKWVVTRFVPEHTHGLESPNKSHCLRSHRNVPDCQVDIAEGLNQVGVGVAKALDFMAGEAGGLENLGFSQLDLRNAYRRRRQSKFSGGGRCLVTILSESIKSRSSIYLRPTSGWGRTSDVIFLG